MPECWRGVRQGWTIPSCVGINNTLVLICLFSKFYPRYKELLELSPNAKVLLTVRDPKQWFTSIRGLNSIGESLANTFPCYVFGTLIGLGRTLEYQKNNLADTYGLAGRLNKAVRSDESEAVKFFNAHIEEVK